MNNDFKKTLSPCIIIRNVTLLKSTFDGKGDPMSDFHQSGPMTTLHKLGNRTPDEMEGEIREFARQRPVALILPSLYSELKGTALQKILEEIKKIPYLRKVVVTLGPATESEFRHARDYFGTLPQKTVLIWNNGPGMTELYTRLEKAGLSAGPDGKGRSVWMALGYLLAEQATRVIALHDCDILTYTRELLDRLVYPVASPDMDYQFCKGYYARFSDRLHGRVTRLYITPLIQALIKTSGDLPILAYLHGFRYPIAGEFCMRDDMAWALQLPSDWGLEIGVLSGIFRNCPLGRICQSELCDRYDHKHQQLSNSPEKGLFKMTFDIAGTFFRILQEEDIPLSGDFFDTLKNTYRHYAQEAIVKYHHESLINNLLFDNQEEKNKVDTFTRAIREAGDAYLKNMRKAPFIPAWTQVSAALPGFMAALQKTVEKDNTPRK